MALDASPTISVRFCVPTDQPRAAERLTSPGRRAIARRVTLERSIHVAATRTPSGRRSRPSPSRRGTLKKWASGSCDSRIKEVVLARLRIGHTRLTHEYILDRGPPSSCLQCNVPLSIEHIIIDCPLFLQQRNVLKNSRLS